MMESTVSEQIVEKVARVTGTDALKLPPLYDSVDTDALNALVESPGYVEISFVYAGQEVCIENDGEISVGECCDSQIAGEIPADD
ncbi:HalOD1 output domain-containing protein [Halobellus rarus]|uniref:HalOD1 output domain-containing protein n=1 Tax=Halobellus rarus TaxID=1126237 RepID=A0ABD6CL87_9EURY|nr:HalOD1 output domain-containing protein [Halobellus rarus]